MAKAKKDGTGDGGAKAAATRNATAAPNLSETRPTVGRVLHAHSPTWIGPRPATVVNTYQSNENTVNVHVEFDRANDRGLRDRFMSSMGGTFCSLPVYDALSPEQRQAALAARPAVTPDAFPVILEWPPRA